MFSIESHAPCVDFDTNPFIYGDISHAFPSVDTSGIVSLVLRMAAYSCRGPCPPISWRRAWSSSPSSRIHTDIPLPTLTTVWDTR